MKIIVAMLVAAAAAAGAVFGLLYLPERARVVEAEVALEAARSGLAEARALLLVHALHDQVLDLLEEARDPAAHEQAMALSTRFFDLVREEAARTGRAKVRTALSAVLTRRDDVTAALARRDPAVRATLEDIRRTLHPLLREPEPGTPPTPASPPPPATPPPGAASATGPSR